MNEKYRIVVDAGHGGIDSGAVSGNLLEKDFNLEAANYMYNRFKELGVPVIITRDSDKSLTRAERINLMRSLGTDPNVIILSNHINAGGGEGAEVIYPLRSSSTLPKAILDEIGNRGAIKRKVYQRALPENPKKDYYYIMRETPNATTLLIEYGFIDNPKDQAKLKNNINDYAEGVVKAVSEYIGVPYNNEIVEDQDDYETYEIVKGDTLYKIANKYDVSVNDLISFNALPSTVLTIGDVIRIPKNNNLIKENVYIVKPGDTLYRISKLYGVSINDLVTINNLTSSILSIGQELIIPLKPVIEEDYVVYEVVPNDTLYSIARRFNTKVDSIKSFNNLTSNLINVGDVLQIPINNSEYAYQIYKVVPGDTLYSLAKRFNTTIDNIMGINNDLTNILSVDQVIKIPR